MLTITTTPELIFMFMSLLPSGSRPTYEERYRTDDKVVCETQAADWSKRLAPARFVCVTHNQTKLLDRLGGAADNVLLFVAQPPAAPDKPVVEELYRAVGKDKATCDAQAAEWSLQLAPTRFACVTHNRGKLEHAAAEDE